MDPKVENASETNLPTSKKCPVCKLISTASAQRCDCGYDFISNTQESPYFKPKSHFVRSAFSSHIIPKDMNLYFIILASLMSLSAVFSLIAGDKIRLIGSLIWGIIIIWLYKKLVQKKNWARIALAIITFPLGLVFGLSTDVKTFIQQKN